MTAEDVRTPLTGEPVLSLHGVGVTFHTHHGAVTALEDLDLTVRQGEILAVVGESGSGKSVAMRAVLGVLPGHAELTGDIRYVGRSLPQLPEGEYAALRGRDIAMIFQEPSVALSPVFTVGQQLVETIRLHRKMSRAAARDYAIEMLDAVGLPDPRNRFSAFPHELSGGQKQRVTIAMAVAMRPKVIIADEPTTALDVTVQAAILDLMRDCRERFGTTIVLITHNMGVVADIADRVVVMRDGRVIESGPTAQVFSEPAREYTRQLIEAVPMIPMPDDAATDAPGAEVPKRASSPLLTVEDLSFTYGAGKRMVYALDAVNFTLGKGELLGIVGESGSGKSTIAQCLTGLLTPVRGSVRIHGEDIAALRPRERRRRAADIGVVFQDPRASIYPRRTVGEAIREPLEIHDVGTPGSRDQRVATMLESVRLPGSFAKRYPHELSGGQRQRVAIARALALDPALMIADEPTSALDVSVQANILELLKELKAELGFGCVFITHDLGVVGTMADNVLVMKDGRVVESGAAGPVLTEPREDYTRQLIEAVPVPDPERQRARRLARAAL